LITKNVKVSNLREFIIKRAPAGVVGGLWAMLPDIDYFLEKPIFHHNVPLDIFFFHGTFDTVIPETDLFFAAEIFLIFVAVNFFAITATVKSFKRLNEAIFGKEEEEDEEEEKMEEKEEPKENEDSKIDVEGAKKNEKLGDEK